MTFYELITQAVRDIETYGYDSQKRLNAWTALIIKKLKEQLIPLPHLEKNLKQTFKNIYQRSIKGNAVLKIHPGVSRFTINKVKPKLHAELQRRILSSADLIKLNREQMIETTLRRFSGWATSIPPGGSRVTETNEVKKNITKALKDLSFNERRVMIDQAHKFSANLNNIIAVDGGAIAGKWRSHYRQPGYDYRVDHKERDSRFYAVRDSWAIQKGLINKGSGYTDEMTMPGEEVFCRCSYIYVYSLNKLPEEMLTKKGKEVLNGVKNAN